MRSLTLTTLLSAALLAASVTETAAAQGPGGGQRTAAGTGQAPAQQQGPTRTEPRGGPSQSPSQSQSQRTSSSRHDNEIRERLRDNDIIGGEMMTAEERREYRERVNSAATDREWAQIRAEHSNEIRARAEDQGHPLEAPIYGEHMMTRQERNDYQKRIASAHSEAELERIRAEHREWIRERATLLGIEAPPTR